MSDDRRRYAPAAARNRDPIRDVLRRWLPDRGLVLEIASGTGEHVVHFAQSCAPSLVFQPTDLDPDARTSIDAWVLALGLQNVRPAVALDAASADWPVAYADAIVCINMIHISPWQATIGLCRGAARILSPGGLLYLYGPFRRDGRHTSPGNARFDADLGRQNPEWGVRDLEAVTARAVGAGFAPPEIESMPANNLSLLFRRSAAARTPEV